MVLIYTMGLGGYLCSERWAGASRSQCVGTLDGRYLWVCGTTRNKEIVFQHEVYPYQYLANQWINKYLRMISSQVPLTSQL